MYMYVLMNNNTKMFVKWFKKIDFKHYVPDIDEATKFTYQQAYQFRSKFKHPENWRIRRWKKVELKENKK